MVVDSVTAFLGTIGGVLLGAGVLYVGTRKGTKRKDLYKGLGALILIASLVMGGGSAIIDKLGTLSVGDQGADSEDVIFREVGQASTVTFKGAIGPWGGVSSESGVGPEYTVVDSMGNILVDDTKTNTTTTATGETLTIYSTDSVYYIDPVTAPITNERPIIDIQAYTTAGQTGPQITVDDSNGDVLTANGNASDTNGPDYVSLDLGAGEEDIFVAKFQNKVADKVFDLGMVCTGYSSPSTVTIDDFELTGTDSASSGVSAVTWTEVDRPKKLTDATMNLNASKDTAGGDTQVPTEVKHCYAPSSVVRLQEWEFIKLQFTVDTDDSNAPSADSDSFVTAWFMDSAYYKDVNGNIMYGPYNEGDGTEDVGTVGIDENSETTYTDLDTAFSIELI